MTVGAGTTGVTVTGSGTSSVTLDGPFPQLNNLLAGALGATVVYQSINAPGATTTLTLVIDDLGNTGIGGPHSATATVPVQILTAVAPPTVDELQALLLLEPQSSNPIQPTPQLIPQPTNQTPAEEPNILQFGPDVDVLRISVEPAPLFPQLVTGNNGFQTSDNNTNAQEGERANFSF